MSDAALFQQIALDLVKYNYDHFTYLFSVINCQKIQRARSDDSPLVPADGSVFASDCSAASAG